MNKHTGYMNSYVGHEQIVAELSESLPHVVLFVGPASVGKSTLAKAIMERYEDCTTWHLLNSATASDVVDISRVAPRNGSNKIITLNITKAKQEALDVLLLALEDSPESTKFILVSDDMPSETIVSRSHVYPFGLLSEEEVYRVLTEVNHCSKDKASLLASRSKGQISAALELAQQEENKLPVLSVLRAFREKDTQILDHASVAWEQKHTDLLQTWAKEALTGRWRIFNEAESGLSKKIIMRVLIASSTSIRPKLMVRSKLMKILRGL